MIASTRKRFPLTRATLVYCATLAAIAFANAAPPAKLSDTQPPPFALESVAAPRMLRDGNYLYAPSPVTGSAIFAVEYLTSKSLAGDAPRKNEFHADEQLPEWIRATNGDYEGSGFDRGHLAAADDHRTAAAKRATFNLSNMTPQNGPLNRGLWRKIETAARDLVDDRTDVYLVTIPLADYRRHKPHTIGAGHILIPTHYAKAALLLRDGQPHAMRAWLAPNHEPKDTEAASYEVNVAEVQQRSQLELFSFLRDDVETRLENAPVP